MMKDICVRFPGGRKKSCRGFSQKFPRLPYDNRLIAFGQVGKIPAGYFLLVGVCGECFVI